jgi:hypothetical protein
MLQNGNEFLIGKEYTHHELMNPAAFLSKIIEWPAAIPATESQSFKQS